MFAFLKRIFHHRQRMRAMVKYEAKVAEKRSSHWPTVEKHFREKNPTCAACGGKAHLQVHHKQPFHSHPELELEETNLIGLCMAVHKDCHILIGHGDSFHWYNPNVAADAAELLAHPERRDAIEARAKANRLVNEPGGS